jgi:hypothetical protein
MTLRRLDPLPELAVVERGREEDERGALKKRCVEGGF